MHLIEILLSAFSTISQAPIIGKDLILLVLLRFKAYSEAKHTWKHYTVFVPDWIFFHRVQMPQSIVWGVSSNVKSLRPRWSVQPIFFSSHRDSTDSLIGLIGKRFRNNIKNRELALDQVSGDSKRYNKISLFNQFRLL